jgi:ABC-type uncharacterized transport system fused permease/ATPase subunit
VNHLDEDAEKYLAQAINLLNKTVNVIRVGHPYAQELLQIIDQLEKSEYMQWLAKERFKEQHG